MQTKRKLRNNGWFHFLCMILWAVIMAAFMTEVVLRFYFTSIAYSMVVGHYGYHNLVFVALLLAALLLWLSLSFSLFLGCGYHADQDTPYLYALEAMPLDLCLPFVITAGFFYIELFFSLSYDYWNSYYSYSSDSIPIFFLFSCAVMFGMEIFMHLFIAQVRCRSLIKCTLIARTLRLLLRFLRIFPSVWRSAGIYTLLFAATLVFGWMAAIGDDGFTVITALGVLFVLWVFGIMVLLQYHELTKKIKRLANGELVETAEDYFCKKKLRFSFRDNYNELCKVGETIDAVVAEKVKHETFQNELITNVSHDIKTPLTSIINYVDLLSREERKENPDAERKIEYMEVLTRQSVRLKKLIEDLIEASKASSGQLTCEFYNFELGIFLSQIAGEYEDRFIGDNLKLNLILPEEPIHIMADARHLSRVIDNLLGNARKYSLANTRIYLELHKDILTNEAVIILKNISATELNISQEELMQRFIRGDKSRHQDGNGLGLSIVRSLTEIQNGKFNIEIDGDLFKAILRFPIIEVEALPDSEAETEEAEVSREFNLNE